MTLGHVVYTVDLALCLAALEAGSHATGSGVLTITRLALVGVDHVLASLSISKDYMMGMTLASPRSII